MAWNTELPPTEHYRFDQTPGHVIEALLTEINAAPIVAIDTETTGLDIMNDVVIVWSLAWNNRRAMFDVGALPYFAKMFARKDKRWALANAKFDMHMLSNTWAPISGEMADTAVMHALLYEEQSHALKDMAANVLGWRWSDFTHTFDMKRGMTARDVLLQGLATDYNRVAEYATNDAWGTLQLYRVLKEELEKTYTFSLYPEEPLYLSTLWGYFDRLELPYTRVLWKNERNGVKIDLEYLARLRPQIEAQMHALERKIAHSAGRPVNVDSTHDLRWLLYEKWGLKPRKMTKGGKSGQHAASTDKKELEFFAREHEGVAWVAERKKLGTFIGNFLLKLAKLVDRQGRIHTRYGQGNVRTGRLSSADPNLQ